MPRRLIDRPAGADGLAGGRSNLTDLANFTEVDGLAVSIMVRPIAVDGAGDATEQVWPC